MSKVFARLLFGLSMSGAVGARADVCEKNEYRINGLVRVSESWLRDYLSLEDRRIRNDGDAQDLKSKIMTTDIFISADVVPSHDSCVVGIHVEEKWTRIPVIRGAYGGGTPLVILGGYETNAFGKLLAVGAEARRYGNMAPGAFFFFKSPRAWKGKGSWGTEVWLDRRRRSFFDDDGVVFGYADSEAWTLKSQVLFPLSEDERSHSQFGFQAQGFHENKTTFHLYPESRSNMVAAPRDLSIPDKSGAGGIFAPLFMYDDLRLNGLNASGVKGRLSSGGVRGEGSSGQFSEAELFLFAEPNNDLNFAAHMYAASTTQKTVGGVYYLGGFDSVRGLPDGVHYGNKMIYGNFEARFIAARFKYAHLQQAVFYDSGSAWMSGANPMSNREASVGGGIRIAIPQIYRFVVRVDYAKSVGATKSSGFSIGLNQFFQPYKMTF